MLRFRAFLTGLTQTSSHFSGEKLEDDLSVTSPRFDEELNGTNPKAKLKKDVRREPQNLWNMALIRFIMSRKQESKRRSATCFLDERFLGQIFQYLPLIDQVCFALTCKRLLIRYKEIARDGSLLPPQPTAYHLPFSYVNSDDKLRIQLLVRHEDSRWTYYAECFLLKLREIFTPNELATLPLKRRCMRYDGAIRLCPCIHLTDRDRNNARILLWSTLTPSPSYYGCLGLEQDRWLLESHICPFHSNKNQEVRISMAISISDKGRMHLNAWYTLKLPISSGDSSGVTKPILACPHLNLFDLIHATGT